MFSPDIDTLTRRFGHQPIFFELTPPPVDQTSEGTRRRREGLKRLQETARVDGINIPEIQQESGKGDRGERKSSFKERLAPRDYADRLRDQYDFGQFVINRVIVQAPESDQREWLKRTYDEYGIRNLVLVGGESSDISYPGPTVTGGNTLVKEDLADEGRDFLVGNICISTRRREDFDEPERMARKLRAGADFFTTQIVAEPESPRRLLRDFGRLLSREDDLDPPALLWSFAPIQAPKDVNFLRWLGVRVPDEVEERILSSSDPASTSVDWARTIWEELQRVEDELSVSIPMGLNVSLVAPRNFGPAVDLVRVLSDAFVSSRAG